MRRRGTSATAHDSRGAALMVAGNCLRRMVLCAVLFGASAQQQQSWRDVRVEAMAVIGVQVAVIVRVGNEGVSASREGGFRRASTGDCPRRQPTALTVFQRRIRTPRSSTPTGAARRYQTEIPLRSTIRDHQGFSPGLWPNEVSGKSDACGRGGGSRLHSPPHFCRSRVTEASEWRTRSQRRVGSLSQFTLRGEAFVWTFTDPTSKKLGAC